MFFIDSIYGSPYWYANYSKGGRLKVAIIDEFSELPTMRLTHFILNEKKVDVGKRWTFFNL